MFDDNVFCKGLFCFKNNRVKCNNCGVFVCKGICSAKYKKKYYCIDCIIEIAIDNLNKEIEKIMAEKYV